MTDKEKKLIEAYIPHPRDPELGFDEYYVRDTADRIRKVYITDIWPHEDAETYGVREVSTGHRIDAGWGSEWIGFYKYVLYDNKEDCKNNSHLLYNDWEHLRELQQKEAPDFYGRRE